ncbi:MAG TPA: peptidylprolyl isomerase [Mycobacteriales bacterium]|nr:peptidylprolyl isomerase [Mycobacteriales bacterium]
MGKGSRQRELARQHARRQAAQRAVQRKKRRRNALLTTGVVVVVAAVLVPLALAGALGSGKKAVAPAASPSATPTPTPALSASATPFVYKDTCDYVADSTGQNPKKPGLPPQKPAHTTGTETFTMTTNRGVITFTGDAAKAPCTTNALAYLASKKYFDNTICHRLTTGTGLKVLQCGDPTGTGSGGPGFTMPDENLTGADYKRGVVAMANTGAAHSGGSQFFLVYGDSQLPPSYTVVGTITKGLDVLDAIAAKGVSGGGQDGKPAETVKVTSITASYAK